MKKVENKETLLALREVLGNIKRNLDYMLEIWELSTSQETKLTPRQKSLIELFHYLVVAEGGFSEIVQAITFILMQNGHDVYNPERMRFVKSYSELYEVPLFIKLQFIKEHELDFVADAVDRKLRNSIAHLRFEVNEDGSIVDTRTGRKIKDISEKINRLGCMCTVTLSAISLSLK